MAVYRRRRLHPCAHLRHGQGGRRHQCQPDGPTLASRQRRLRWHHHLPGAREHLSSNHQRRRRFHRQRLHLCAQRPCITCRQLRNEHSWEMPAHRRHHHRVGDAGQHRDGEQARPHELGVGPGLDRAEDRRPEPERRSWASCSRTSSSLPVGAAVGSKFAPGFVRPMLAVTAARAGR